MSAGITRAPSTQPVPGHLMRVRADETHTLEDRAGHSAVSGAHRSPAGGCAGVCRGGLPGRGRHSPVIINEAYLSGGSTGAAFKNKFVELYNTSDAPVALDGWSLQYRSATGTGVPSSTVPLTGTIAAKGFYLLKGGNNGTPTAPACRPLTPAAGFNPAGATAPSPSPSRPRPLTPLPTGSLVSPPRSPTCSATGPPTPTRPRRPPRPRDNMTHELQPQELRGHRQQLRRLHPQRDRHPQGRQRPGRPRWIPR